MQARLAFVIFAASVACSNAASAAPPADRTKVMEGDGGCYNLKNLSACCASYDGRAGEFKHEPCVPTQALAEGVAATKENMFNQIHVCQPKCWAEGKCDIETPSSLMGECSAASPDTATTTHTPWDSSASSIDTDSLKSSWSSSFKEESSADSFGSSESGFLGSGSSNDASFDSSGSEQSGSSGSYMFHWQWLLLLLCCCAAVIAPLLKPKPKKKPAKKGPAKTNLVSDHPAGCTYLEVASQTGFKAGQVIEIGTGAAKELAEVTGLGSILLAAPISAAYPTGTPVVEVTDGRKPSAPIALVPTTTVVIPSYQMAAPATTAYAAPVAYAAPATTAYAAAPAYGTTSYAVSGGNVV